MRRSIGLFFGAIALALALPGAAPRPTPRAST
jgi:hypothetical protein